MHQTADRRGGTMAKQKFNLKEKLRLKEKFNNKENPIIRALFKERRVNMEKLTDKAADLVFKTDDFLDKVGPWMSRQWAKVCNGAAGIITAHDKLQAITDRRAYIIHYHVAKWAHEFRETLSEYRKTIIAYFIGALLIAIGMVALFDSCTGYEYSYNGRVLGIVKNQEDVVKVLDLVSEQLSAEHGSKITIEAGSDITFKNVVSVNKDVDDIDTVVKRLTYMRDMQAEAYAIYADGEIKVIVESREAAKAVLKAVQDVYLTDSKKTKYESVGFVENVQIKYFSTKLANISSLKSAKEKILTGGKGQITYKVKKGDTISEICSKHDISLSALKKMNKKLKPDSIHIGQKIVISTAIPSLTVETVEVSTYTEKVKYKTKYKKTSSLYKDETQVSRSGVNGKRVVTARITRSNGDVTDRDILETETIKKPVSKIILKGTKPLPLRQGTGSFISPVSGYSLTSYFGYRWGRMHEGIDMACATGTTIRASDGGTVVYAGWYYGYGYMIEINHGGNMHTRYGHCSRLNVSVGEKVYQGQKIGEVGNTGNSYGSHCHFEVLKSGTPVNPLNYI